MMGKNYENEGEMINYIKKVLKVDKNKMIIIRIEDGDERNMFHQFLDNTYPGFKVFASSVKCGFNENAKDNDWTKCFHCDYKYVKVKYHYGYESNNRDESYSGTCPQCDEYISIEPNYDDMRVYHAKNNDAIAISDYFNNYSHKNRDKNNDPNLLFKITKIITHNSIIIIDSPSKSLNKNQLNEYINSKINKNN